MTDPTASNPLPESPGPKVRLSHPITDLLQTFAGQFAAGANAAAAAGDGELIQYSGIIGQALLGGQFSDETLGNALTPPAENNWDGSGRVLKRVAVTGATNNATNFLGAVWADSSGPPLLLADPGITPPFGVILDVTAAGEADVWQFGLEAQFLLGIIGNSAFAASLLSAFGVRVGVRI